jgi:hypothetical protein
MRTMVWMELVQCEGANMALNGDERVILQRFCVRPPEGFFTQRFVFVHPKASSHSALCSSTRRLLHTALCVRPPEGFFTQRFVFVHLKKASSHSALCSST